MAAEQLGAERVNYVDQGDGVDVDDGPEVKLRLPDQVLDALTSAAIKERRDPTRHAEWILIQHLRRRGQLERAGRAQTAAHVRETR